MSSGTSASIQSAVTFLRDPSVQNSPVASKIAFLQAKGLTQQDIDTALRLAGDGGPVAGPSQPAAYPYAGNAIGGGQRYYYPTEREGPTWKDWYMVATIGGAAGTLLYSLARKYLVPALAPPSETELTAAQDALTAKYDEAAAILHSLQAETAEIKSTLQEQCAKVDESVDQVSSALSSIKEKDASRDDELRHIKEEVDSMKSLMEKMFDKHKDAQTASLNDIQQEVKSLKSLLARRNATPAADEVSPSTASGSGSGSGTSAASASSQSHAPSTHTPHSSSSPYTTAGRFGTRSSASSPSSIANIANRPPGIPAWQMQASDDTPAAAPPAQKKRSGEEVDKSASGKAAQVNGSNGSGSEYEEVKKPENETGAAEITQ